MFLDFYQMKEQPFGVTPDPRFLYLGKSHREALASLYYGVESSRGFVALIAPPGLGKTTLTFQLLEKLQQTCRTVFLSQTQCTSKELLRYLLDALGVDSEGMELVSMHNKLNQILCREMLAGRRFVLAIDETQNLDPEVLETVRLLSNFETSQSKLLQILLIGQPQLAGKLASPEMEQLQQRISVFARLDPFGYDDVANYIAHRLKVAGYSGAPLFSSGALRLIAEKSQGIPRKISSLCFSALSLGCAMGRKQIDVAIMQEVLADRDIEALQMPKISSSAVASPAHPSQPVPSVATTPPGLTYAAPAPAPLSLASEKSGRSVIGWAAGVASVAALVAICIGIFSLSPGRIDGFLRVSSETWNSIRSAAGSAASSTTVQSDSGNVQAAELPMDDSVQPASTSDLAQSNAVIVQPGDTLRKILVRNSGVYNQASIEQIRNLNPSIPDLNQLEIGQEIRIPNVSIPVDSAGADVHASMTGKNQGMGPHE